MLVANLQQKAPQIDTDENRHTKHFHETGFVSFVLKRYSQQLKYVNDSIRTVVFWCLKQQLYQLCLSLCPSRINPRTVFIK